MRTTHLLLSSVLCCLPLLTFSVQAETVADSDNVFLPVLIDETAPVEEADAPEVSLEETIYSESQGEATAIPVVTTTEPAAVATAASRMMGKPEVHTADELLALLTRAERIASGLDEYTTTDPIALVLNGEEIDLFKRENYRQNKALVDLAARLEAFNIVDIKVCKYWMYQRGIDTRDLPPFVQTVPEAEQEVKRLQKAGYVQF